MFPEILLQMDAGRLSHLVYLHTLIVSSLLFSLVIRYAVKLSHNQSNARVGVAHQVLFAYFLGYGFFVVHASAYKLPWDFAAILGDLALILAVSLCLTFSIHNQSSRFPVLLCRYRYPLLLSLGVVFVVTVPTNYGEVVRGATTLLLVILLYLGVAISYFSKWRRLDMGEKIIAVVAVYALLTAALLPASVRPNVPLHVVMSSIFVSQMPFILAFSVGVLLNIVRELTEELRDGANRDWLSGLYNRRYLFDHMDRIHEISKRAGTSTEVVLLDIDNFKTINDQYGHGVGDEVIRSVAKLLGQNVRINDCCFRVGGEEFLVLMPDSTAEGGLNLAERIRQAVSAHSYCAGDLQFNVTVSLGHVSVPHDKSVKDGILEADQLLYQSKDNGRDQVTSASDQGDPPSIDLVVAAKPS